MSTSLGRNVFTPYTAGSSKNQLNALTDPFNLGGWNSPEPYSVDFSSMPQYPGFNPIYDYNKEALAPEFQAQLGAINPDQSGLKAYEQSALRSGPSPWANLATAKSYQDQALSNDILAKNNASSVATARGGLAAHGGLRSGASERLATAGNNNLLSQQQGNAATGMQNRSQIGINDEQNRIAQLGQLPGMELQQAQFGLQKAGMGEAAKATDVQNSMLGNEALNQYNLGAYSTQGQQWAAGQQANATARSGSGGSKSWLCGEAAKQLGYRYTRDEQRALLELKNYAQEVRPGLSKFYFGKCERLAHEMTAAGASWKEPMEFIKRVILQVTAGDLEGAFERYKDFVRDLIAKYWLGRTHPAYVGVA